MKTKFHICSDSGIHRLCVACFHSEDHVKCENKDDFGTCADGHWCKLMKKEQTCNCIEIE